MPICYQKFPWRRAAGEATMPIYEYRCTACGHELEVLQKLSDSPLTECPACHKPELRKLVSAAGFQLKGSGWYVTDFRNKGTKPAKDKSPAAEGAPKANGGDGPASTTSGDAATSETKSTDKAATSTDAKPATTTPKSEA